MKAAVIARTKLNMKAIRIRTWETPIRISSSSVPRSRASSTRRETPSPTSATDTRVRIARTHTTRLRMSSDTASLAMTITTVVPGLR